MISKQTIEQIRNANDIVDVVGSYLQLKRAGTAVKALCPFHKEKTPSFTVNGHRQIFHCFGCGAGGDVFKFIMQYESVEFMEAARLLAHRAGLQIQFDDGPGGRDDGAGKEMLLKLHEDLAEFYHRVLIEHADGEAARRYLGDRKMDKVIIEQFKLGFAPARTQAVRQWAEKKKYSVDQVVAAGILAKGERGEDDLYDRFRGRLMFPIRDELGRVIAFSGRIIEKDQHPAKYVNSPETIVFKKGRILYALDRARRPILEARSALVCEGQIDVIRCHGAGLVTAVAGLGTALTDDHARLLKRYADSVTLLMDADTAGQNSAIRAAETFMGAGLSVLIATLPPGEDPDSLILKDGAEKISAVIEAAQPAMDFHIDVLRAREDVSTEAGLMRVAREILDSVSRVPTELQRDLLMRRAAHRLNLSDSAMRALRADLKPQTKRPAAAAETRKPETAPAEHPYEEVEIARLLAHHPDCGHLIKKYLPSPEFTDPACRTIVTHLLEGDLDFTMDGAESGRLAAEILATEKMISVAEVPAEQTAQDLILRIRRRSLLRRRKTLEDQRNKAEGAERDRVHTELAQLILDLQILAKEGWDKARPILEFHAG